MATDRWLTTIGSLTQNIFWGIGYFAGFSLVMILSVGTLNSEEFTNITRGRRERHPYWIYKREGRFYLVAEIVSAIGWMFLTALLWGFLSVGF